MIFKLKILILVYLIGSHWIKLKTFYLVNLLTFCFVKALNSILKVIILPSFCSLKANAILACFLLIIKVINFI